jgi:hypothetical protein
MKLYKLTDLRNVTRNNTIWGEGITHNARDGEGPMCSTYWIHAYTDPVLAAITNPAHADIANPILWEAVGEVRISDGLKVGCKSLTTVKKMLVPEVTITQKVAFGILCAKQVYHEKNWNNWADLWLSGADRTRKSAAARAHAADAAAANAAAHAAVYADAVAAHAAVYAANAAARADAVYADTAARAAARAAAHAADYAAAHAALISKSIDFTVLAQQCLKF